MILKKNLEANRKKMNKLSYEKCKELKDAGFSQGDFLGNHFYTYNSQDRGKIKMVGFEVKGQDEVNKKDIKIPTLSELIEACGDKFDRLEQQFVNLDGEDEISWAACYDKVLLVERGKTPEEAVANLWLELNKNKNTVDKNIDSTATGEIDIDKLVENNQ